MEINTIYNEDCLSGMDKLPDKSIDCVICDLPYSSTSLKWDVIIPFDQLWSHYNRVVKDNGAILLFGQEPFSSCLRISNIKQYRYDLYWQKERAVNIFQMKKRPGKVIETISVFYQKQCTYNPQMTVHSGKKAANKIKHGKLGSLVDHAEKTPYEYNDTGLRYPLQIIQFQRDILTNNLHPTQKPLALLEYLVNTYTNLGDLVLDNCIGSGTTAVACINTHRNYVGFEIDKKYYDIAMNRIFQTTTTGNEV